MHRLRNDVVDARKMLLPFVATFLVAANAMAAERPNFLFIIFDDMSWNTAGVYGCDWVKTPNIDRVAREGVKFQHAFTSNPKCSPCRASILTGRNTWQLEELSVHNSIFPKKWAVFPDLLEASGYEVGLTGKGWGPGDHTGQGWNRNPAGPSFDQHKSSPPAGLIFDLSKGDYVGSVFLSFLLRCHSLAKKSASEIVLAGPSEPARELLHLLDLETLWAIYDTRQEAIDALSAD